jgi:TM2 domain-containing membrane protein YozV
MIKALLPMMSLKQKKTVTRNLIILLNQILYKNRNRQVDIMGFRFRKSIKIAPGIKFNINKKSVGMTIGTRGAHYTVNSKGTRTTSVGIPGTGLSYSDIKTTKKRHRTRATSHQNSRGTSRGAAPVYDPPILRNDLTNDELVLLNNEIKRRGKNIAVAYILGIFLGILGGHRFYLGKIGTAIIMLLITAGTMGYGIMVTGIWTIIDLFRMPVMIERKNLILENKIAQEILERRQNHPTT